MTTPNDPNGYPPPGQNQAAGYPPPQQGTPGYGAAPGYGTAPAKPRNGLGIAALILGILAIIGIVTVYGAIILGIIAIVLGIIGRGRVKRGEATNGGMAISGVVLGIIAVVIAAVLIVAGVALLNSGKGKCIKNAHTQSQKQQCLNK